MLLTCCLQTGEQLRFSQQELVDCSWGEGNNGCDGGEDFRAYQWILKHGLATEDAYGSYLGIVSSDCVLFVAVLVLLESCKKFDQEFLSTYRNLC
jgi:Papain family cysteine protease